jgi:hypothetical protein
MVELGGIMNLSAWDAFFIRWRILIVAVLVDAVVEGRLFKNFQRFTVSAFLMARPTISLIPW